MRLLHPLLLSLMLVACGASDSSPANAATPAPSGVLDPGPGQDVATFAGGCFWCMVGPFAELPGVVAVTSGYTGGQVANPTYEQVSSGQTGHAESVQIVFEPTKVSYDQLLKIFWHSIDPTDANGQFCDSGNQYRTAVFFHGAAQQKAAEASRDALAASGVLKAPITTQITAASTFYPAEEHHQDYYRKREIQYQIYRQGCGRDRRLKELYGADAAAH